VDAHDEAVRAKHRRHRRITERLGFAQRHLPGLGTVNLSPAPPPREPECRASHPDAARSIP
jgi:hypothetical protein